MDDQLRRGAKTWPDRLVATLADSSVRWSYDSCNREADRRATWLQRLGARFSNAVPLLLESSFDMDEVRA